MATVHIDNVGEIAVMECAGTFVGKKAALKLRDAVKAQTNALIVILDLTEMRAIGKSGLRVLVLLKRWTQDHNIRFKLFNPSIAVRDKLRHVDCEIATLEQMMNLLSCVDILYAQALIESQFPIHRLLKYA